MICRLCVSIYDSTQFDYILIVDVVLRDFATSNDYVGLLQSTVRTNVDP